MKWIYEHKQITLLGCMFLVGMLVVCYLLYQPLVYVLQNAQQLRFMMEEFPLLGRICITIFMCLQVVFIFLPGEIIEVVSGLLFGPIEGMVYCMLGVCIGSFLIFALVKKFGASFVYMCTGKKEVEELSILKNSSQLVMLLFFIFLIPGTPKDIITYFIPFSKMRLSTFLCITTIARIPSIITSTISGDALGLQKYELFGFVIGASILVSIIGFLFYQNWMKCRSENL